MIHQSPPSPPPSENVLFEAVTSLDAQVTALHCCLCGNREQRQVGGAGGANAVRRTMADDRALEEVVMCAQMGLLFIGVKT
jgi:hypothetical protein